MEAVEPLRHRSQIDKMKRVLKQRSPRDYCLFVLGINTGLRVGDLLELTVGDVLEGSGSRLKIAGRMTLREQKTHKKRCVVLNTGARSALSAYLKTRKRRFPEDPLFLSRKHTQDGSLKSLSRQQVWAILSTAAHLSGISLSIGTHTMRKTFGYFRYIDGQPVEQLQKIFNHSHPAITLAYIGITKEIIDDSYRKTVL